LPIDERLQAETDDKPRQRLDRLSRLEAARVRAADELKRLPRELLELDSEPNYRIRMSEQLVGERERLRARIEASNQ
jgi:hypothetical protein